MLAMRQNMRFPGGLARALTFSYDDGVVQDVRLLSMFEKYGMRGTFNVNSALFHKEGEPYDPNRINRRMTERQALEAYTSAPFAEVACHGAEHMFLNLVPTSVAMQEVVADRLRLEQMFGRIVRGMAYAFGTYDDDSIEILRLAGIDYCRTVAPTHRFDIPKNWLRLDPTCHHNDPMMDELIDSFLQTDTKAAEFPRMFYIWGHSYEFDIHQNWDRMEHILSRLTGIDGVWYATNGEIFDYVRDFKRLVYSADMSVVQNPTARDLYFSVGGETVCVPAGQTVSVPVKK